MKLPLNYLILPAFFVLPVSVCYSYGASESTANVPRTENTGRATYPVTAYSFETPAGWSYKDNPQGFMRAKVVKTVTGTAKLEIKFLTTPANAYATSKKGELLRQSEGAARKLIRSPGFKAIRMSAVKYRSCPAYEAEYLIVANGKKTFHRVLTFDDGKGIFMILGAISPAPAAVSEKSHIEFERAWKQIAKTLTPEYHKTK